MIFLLDSNIWLEHILDQARADEVAQLLSAVRVDQLCLTEFSLYSIGIHLLRRAVPEAYQQFVDKVVIADQVRILRIEPQEMEQMLRVASDYRLDFDDAYQYVVAEKHDLRIVSFDADFDRTPRGRLTPRQAIEQLDQTAGQAGQG